MKVKASSFIVQIERLEEFLLLSCNVGEGKFVVLHTRIQKLQQVMSVLRHPAKLMAIGGQITIEWLMV